MATSCTQWHHGSKVYEAKTEGAEQCWGLTPDNLVFLGRLLIKMSLFISSTPLISPRNLYIHCLIHCVLQRLSPVIHVYMFGLYQAGFHLSLSILSTLDVSEGNCNSQTKRKDKVALILITAVHILHCNHSHTSAQMLGRRGDWHGVLLHIASGNP